jgi:hypothetical protein
MTLRTYYMGMQLMKPIVDSYMVSEFYTKVINQNRVTKILGIRIDTINYETLLIYREITCMMSIK